MQTLFHWGGGVFLETSAFPSISLGIKYYRQGWSAWVAIVNPDSKATSKKTHRWGKDQDLRVNDLAFFKVWSSKCFSRAAWGLQWQQHIFAKQLQRVSIFGWNGPSLVSDQALVLGEMQAPCGWPQDPRLLLIKSASPSANSSFQRWSAGLIHRAADNNCVVRRLRVGWEVKV